MNVRVTRFAQAALVTKITIVTRLAQNLLGQLRKIVANSAASYTDFEALSLYEHITRHALVAIWACRPELAARGNQKIKSRLFENDSWCAYTWRWIARTSRVAKRTETFDIIALISNLENTTNMPVTH